MKDKNFKIMMYLGLAWLAGFILTLALKAPFLRGVEELITVLCVGWFAYWTLSEVRSFFKRETFIGQEIKELKETNAKSKKSPK
jgi:hypothetical protein